MNRLNDFQGSARLLKILGHPVRLKIVCGLLSEPANLSRIARDLRLPVSTLAQHLAILRNGGLLTEQRRGVEVYFHVSDRRVPSVLKALCRPSPTTAGLPRWRWQELNG